MKQTPINQVCNVDVLQYMRPDYKLVVEVGSSSGVLARAYRDINPNCEYVGIEIDADYAEASKQNCTEVILGNVERLGDEVFERLAKADCWVFADALEHLYDPWALLNKIKSFSVGTPEVVVCIPNAQYWGLQSTLNSGRFFYQDSGLLDRTHIRWFTRITLLDMFNTTGYDVLEMKARIFHQPPEAVIAAIRGLAVSVGNEPDLAQTDALAFQYVLRAVLKVDVK
ncbi:MAG: methyltransferase domain-containing protein [Pseudomonas sp.]|nr:methyltransferase domain-containing protein [Pseudomonas sp.]